jgi:DNA polymerase-3 subunit gamma/tau
VAIDEGRFVDLIEVDAASRTGVDDTRELLDNVQYTPSAGRFKVYLIDEVHMLSKQSFNALLKTLEEPPPHVKFLLATTDPQKVPVTVLSRCLQFNLKRLPTALIAEQMTRICREEAFDVEPAALGRLARAAAGSMRDGLSLLDQALAYGNQQLREQEVSEMLGTLDRGRVIALLDALARSDAATLLGRIRELDQLVPDYSGLLDDLARAFQRIAVIQLAGADTLEDNEDLRALMGLATAFDPDTTQLFYQIAVTARRDLPLAPDPRLGFEMAILRMLAFQPSRTPATAVPVSAPAVAARSGCDPVATAAPKLDGAGDWREFVRALALEGAVRELAMHSAFLYRTPFELRLGIDRSNAHLMTEQLRNRLAAVIQERLGEKLSIRFDMQDQAPDTPAAHGERSRDKAQQHARRAIESDPNVRDLADLLGAELVPDSVKPMRPDAGDAN